MGDIGFVAVSAHLARRYDIVAAKLHELDRAESNVI